MYVNINKIDGEYIGGTIEGVFYVFVCLYQTGVPLIINRSLSSV